MEKARANAGIGIDPTIKALIWNPLTGSEEEKDEAEHGSDVLVMNNPQVISGSNNNQQLQQQATDQTSNVT